MNVQTVARRVADEDFAGVGPAETYNPQAVPSGLVGH